MTNLVKLTVDVTTVNIGTPVLLNKTPLAGGAGRTAICHLHDLPITSTFKIQGHNGRGTENADGTFDPPAEADTGWFDIATVDSTSDRVTEIELPLWVRVNTTVLDADGPDVVATLEGIK